MCGKTRLLPVVETDKLTHTEAGNAAEQLAELFVNQYKPSYEDDAATRIEEVLDAMISAGVAITEADLNNPAFQGVLFALANKELEWEER